MAPLSLNALLVAAAFASTTLAGDFAHGKRNPSAAHHAPPVMRSAIPESLTTRTRQTRHLRWEDGNPLNDLFERAPAPPPAPVRDDGYIQPYDPKVGPQRGVKGAPFYHPSNEEIDEQNPDNVARPPTDNGNVPTLKWAISLASTRLLKGGWVREQLVSDLPVSKDFAAAELALKPYAYRELHWHRVAEWAYVLKGNGRLHVLDEFGKTYNSDIEEGDIWYFPQGSGHSFQALDKGLEILVAFTDGNFESAGTTFMLSDWLIHTPKYILAKNFGVDVKIFDNLPAAFPYIYQSPSGAVPPKTPKPISSPDGEAKNPFVFKTSKAAPIKAKGGWIKIADSTTFPASTKVASSVVHIDVGGLRELHWHPLADEWIYIVQGKARITAFMGGAASRTFDFETGDTGVLPSNSGHYVENIGKEPLVFLELYKAPRVSDISATQWLALTPHQAVADLLNISTSVVDGFSKQRQLII